MLGLKLNHVSKRGHKETTRGDIIIPWDHMMTSSNGSIFRVTGPLSGESSSQRPVTRSFGFFFDLCLNKRLSKQSWGWRFETPSCSLWRHCNDLNIPSLVRYVMRLETVFHLFRKWLGAEQATSYYQIQWWPVIKTTPSNIIQQESKQDSCFIKENDALVFVWRVAAIFSRDILLYKRRPVIWYD